MRFRAGCTMHNTSFLLLLGNTFYLSLSMFYFQNSNDLFSICFRLLNKTHHLCIIFPLYTSEKKEEVNSVYMTIKYARVFFLSRLVRLPAITYDACDYDASV